MGNREEALKIYREILEEEPTNSIAHVNVGRMLVLMGHVDEAIRALKKAVELQPDNGQALLLITLAYLQKGDKAAARNYYETYLSEGFSPNPQVEQEMGATPGEPLRVR
jgi:tetratricopeptide (TPR) repeat protein